MTPLDGLPVLTAAAMRAAEDATGESAGTLMVRAGAGVAEQVRRLAAGAEVLVLCGPGNNGGDGYVAASVLKERGATVRVAALGEPATEAAIAARARWGGAIEPFPEALPDDRSYAPVVVDALFGTGLSRPLARPVSQAVDLLAQHARLAIAVDLPSGVAADTGAELDPVMTAQFDVTFALGALKPAHLLQPAAALCGDVRLIDIGLGLGDVPSPREQVSAVWTIDRPRLSPPAAHSHKYRRGMVAVVAGPMHGASELAARAAYRAGAGYVLLLSGGLPHPPHAIVRRPWRAEALADPRIGAVVIGPGLGRDDRAQEKLAAALDCPHPLVIDGDALHLLDLARLRGREAPVVLTPHAGEFAALFGEGEGSKIERTREAARRAGAVVIHKGADTVVAASNGHADLAVRSDPWLSVAGTGDVLAGAVGTMLAQRTWDWFGAASAAVWLHTEAAQRLDRCFLADDLADALPAALAAASGR